MSLETGLLLLVLVLLAAVLAVLLLRRPGADPGLAAQIGALQGGIAAELAQRAAGLSRELSGFTLEQTRALNEAARREAEAQRGLLESQRGTLTEGLGRAQLALEQVRTTLTEGQGRLAAQLAQEMTQARNLLDARLKELREGNEQKLAEIQKTVNEQLQAAVEKQMTDSFARVIDQFAALQKAMGDVAAVTSQIGDLKRLFSNVKARGGWGEAQLRALLDDVLPAGGYEANVKLDPESDTAVEFALVMPQRGPERVLLPVDAKFPSEDYDRLQQAAEAGDAEGEKAARRGLEQRLRTEAQKIGEKYIRPPRTTEFAVLYLPTEGLYAEAARLPGLLETLHREHRVMVLGPSLLPAMLRTIQLGHVTLHLSEKAEEVKLLLGATKAEMTKMDEVLERLGKQAGTFGNTIETARRRTRAVTRKLRAVEALDAAQAEALLELEAPEDDAP